MEICVKHRMSLLSFLEGWATSDSWVILKKSPKIALEELKQSESRIWKLALSTLPQRFSWRDLTHCREDTREMV